ncbi:DNA-binding transcriptional regulator, XRE-family HTH domain [Tenacibaculum sp. MAR_2009_124]|uniref:helix-turn-helix domain-containing protein n=1 Tax=Tenacibaculum sp. MAR_2009_124 TaxID=1250059 RepID=UPI0008998DA4|nr:helix-turn-helix transcriptional regulator [Tenacibaculum sp. MAR_2009_124]SEC57054.1 DNA-binding transcriptional regulator, XRE-family HTH domain [Tenacibaculum sp. MAR_2009_124]
MTLGYNITKLRKQLKLSQNELGKRAGTSGDIIGRYERDEVKPSIEVAAKIADVLDVSLDFLLGKVNVKVDNSILKRVIEVQQMDNKDKEHILYTLDALIKNVKLKSIT